MNTLHPPDTDRVPRGWMIWLSLGLLIVPLILFAQPLAQNLLIFGWDTVGEFAHWRPWLFGWLKKGVLPFYNPYLLSGYPLGLDPQQAPFYAPNWLYAWMPFAQALALSALLHTWWAGLGAYRLSRALGSHRWLALAAALCWQGCSLFQGQLVLGGIPQHCTLAWGAWVLLCVERLLVKPSPRRASLLALVAGLSFYAGHTQYALYFAYAGGVYALVRLWQDKTLAEKPALRALGLAALLLGGLLAVQLVMVGHLGGMSVRQGGMNPFEDNTTLVVFNLLSFFMPTAMGLETRNYYWGLGVMNLWMPFVGILWPWLWLSRWRNAFDTPRVAACAAAMVFCLGMGVGLPNLIAMAGFESLPGLNLMRAPMRWWAVACLLMATGGAALMSQEVDAYFKKLSSITLAELETRPKNSPILSHPLKPIWFLFPIAIYFAGLLMQEFPTAFRKLLDLWFAKGKIPSIANYHPYYPKLLLKRGPESMALSGAMTFWAMAYYFLITFYVNIKLGAPSKIVDILAIVWPTTFLSIGLIVLVSNNSSAFCEKSTLELKHISASGRWASFTPALATTMPCAIKKNYWWHQRFAQQHQHMGIKHQLPNIAGYVSLPPKDYLLLMNGPNPKTGEPLAFDWNFPNRPSLLSLMGVRALIQTKPFNKKGPYGKWCAPWMYGFLDKKHHPSGQSFDGLYFCLDTPGFGFEEWEPSATFDQWQVLRNPDPFPMSWPVRQWQKLPTAQWLKKTRAAGNRLRHTAFTLTPLPIAQNTGPLLPQEKVIWTQGATPNLLQLKSTLDKKRLVLASLPFDTAWTARVNGRAVKLYKVNFALTGLVLPRGTHTVLLKYEPPWFSLAAAVSLFFAVLCLLLQAAPRPLGAPAPPPHDG